ncbi:MAG: HPr family phosphocarrier protein [Armatimonadetes bacterium]|nr:HPr family phosphocarrier protein [Armatimonadota bacterium]
MVNQEVQIKFKIGIHSRPAALIVQKVKEYPDTKIYLAKNGKEVEAKSLIGILSLEINEGSVINIKVDGKGEKQILKEIIELIEIKLA